MERKQLSKKTQMFCIFPFIDSASTQKTSQPKVEGIAEKERVSESMPLLSQLLTHRNVNIPWAVGNVGDADYIYAFQKVVMPIAYEFNPQLVIGIPSHSPS
jgi:hypothetical protein